MLFSITEKIIKIDKLKKNTWREDVGAASIFEGLVRNVNEGKQVSSLEYECYKEMALKIGENILLEALEKFEIIGCECVHRVGHLQIGDMAIGVVTTSRHRKAAMQACDWIVDEVKRKVPIWKKEHYTNSEAEWIFCPNCKSYAQNSFEDHHHGCAHS